MKAAKGKKAAEDFTTPEACAKAGLVEIRAGISLVHGEAPAEDVASCFLDKKLVPFVRRCRTGPTGFVEHALVGEDGKPVKGEDGGGPTWVVAEGDVRAFKRP